MSLTLKVDGYEIMEHRYNFAQSLIAKYGLGDMVTFFLEDATRSEAQWADTKLYYVTDLLWDAHTRDRLYTRIVHNAGPGSIMISNRPCGDMEEMSSGASWHCMADKVIVPTSWKVDQAFYVLALECQLVEHSENKKVDAPPGASSVHDAALSEKAALPEKAHPSYEAMTCPNAVVVDCKRQNTSVTTTACFSYKEQSWRVTVTACSECVTPGEKSSACVAPDKLAMAHRGLVTALNEAGIAQIIIIQMLPRCFQAARDSRLLMTHFIIGFVQSMVGRGASLHHSLNKTTLRVGGVAAPHHEAEPHANDQYCETLDRSIAAGFLSSAVRAAQDSGWHPSFLRLAKLPALLADIRTNNQTMYEQLAATRLNQKEVKEAMDRTGYSLLNFGGESKSNTFYASLLRVLGTPGIQRRLIAAAARGGFQEHIVVLGSHLGWQCALAALTFGMRADGYELLQHRLNESMELMRRHSIDGVVMHHQDAAKSQPDWGTVGIVYFTDLLWDKAVRCD